MPDPAKVYEGAPCRTCGGTVRWKSARRCVECGRRATLKHQRKKYREDPAYREARKARSRRDYDRLDAVGRAGRQLKNRRVKALHRRAERHRRGAVDGPVPREGRG